MSHSIIFFQKTLNEGTNSFFLSKISKYFRVSILTAISFIFLGQILFNLDSNKIWLSIIYAFLITSFIIYYIVIPNFAYIIPRLRKKYLLILKEYNLVFINGISEVLKNSEKQILVNGRHDYKNEIFEKNVPTWKANLKTFTGLPNARIDPADEDINILIENLINIRVQLVILNLKAENLEDIKYVKLLSAEYPSDPTVEEFVILDKIESSARIARDAKERLDKSLHCERLPLMSDINLKLAKF